MVHWYIAVCLQKVSLCNLRLLLTYLFAPFFTSIYHLLESFSILLRAVVAFEFVLLHHNSFNCYSRLQRYKKFWKVIRI